MGTYQSPGKASYRSPFPGSRHRRRSPPESSKRCRDAFGRFGRNANVALRSPGAGSSPGPSSKRRRSTLSRARLCTKRREIRGCRHLRSLRRTEGELVDTAPTMLDRPMVINPLERAFEQRPHALDAVRVHTLPHELFLAVFDALMKRRQPLDVSIGKVVVREDHRARLD